MDRWVDCVIISNPVQGEQPNEEPGPNWELIKNRVSLLD